MKTLALAALALLFSLSAQAADVAPAHAVRHDFRSGASMLVYYTAEADGFHVVATVQSDDSERQSVLRVTSTLAPGQSTIVSVPAAPGAPADAVQISRMGDTLQVAPVPLVTARK